jgi:hypothetical protein
LAHIAAEMKAPAIPNSDERELRRYRQFYMIYPAADHLIADNNQIRELLPPELMRVEVETSNTSNRGSVPLGAGAARSLIAISART